MPITLNAERALVFRITHIDNVPFILRNGLHCRNSRTTDDAFTPIGNPELIARRVAREVPTPPGGTLADFVSFYFTPHSPMLYNVTTGWGVSPVPQADIVMIVASLRRWQELGVRFVFTDRHAYLATARFTADLADLDMIDWDSLRSRDFKRRPDDPEQFERYQAEALAHRHVPLEAIEGLVCRGVEERRKLEAMMESVGRSLIVQVRPDCYF